MADDTEAADLLVSTLREWTQELSLPALGQCGMGERDLARVAGSIRSGGMRSNPIELGPDELTEILSRRL